MADGDVYKVTLEWRYASVDVAVQNVLYFKQELDEPTLIPEQVLGTRLATAFPAVGGWAGDFRGFLSLDFSILNIRVQRLFPVVTGAYLTPVNRAGTGPNTFAFVPSSAAMVVRLRSDLNTRRGHGRLYLGGFAGARVSTLETTLLNVGTWTAAARTAAEAWFNSLVVAAALVGFGDAIYHAGVWSKAIAGPSPPYSDGWHLLNTWEVTSAIRCQRRREVGVGI